VGNAGGARDGRPDGARSLAPLTIESEVLAARERRSSSAPSGCSPQGRRRGPASTALLKDQAAGHELPPEAATNRSGLPGPEINRQKRPSPPISPSQSPFCHRDVRCRAARGRFGVPDPRNRGTASTLPIVPLARRCRRPMPCNVRRGFLQRHLAVLDFHQWTLSQRRSDREFLRAAAPEGEWMLLDAESWIGSRCPRPGDGRDLPTSAAISPARGHP